MLIESCVAAPATPNGKPVMPGSESASAFYHPNRQQQMQPMMERQPSLESQYSSMQQQFVPSQSHQIEDIVAVSTTNIKKPNPETTNPLGKQSTIEAIAWAQPFEGSTFSKGAVSSIIRERAKSKVTVVNENGSPEDSPEKCKEHVDMLDYLAGEGKMSSSEHTTENRKEQSDAPLEECQALLQEESSLPDERSQLLSSSSEKQTPPSEESNVFGFFKKIHSFLFSPASPKRKHSVESESSCCESDFDSEFSEMTQGSFNPGDIEAIRDELEILLSGSPTQGLKSSDGFPYGESSNSQQTSPPPLEQEDRGVDSGDKSAPENKDGGKKLMGKVEDAARLEETMTYKKLLENTEIEQSKEEDISSKVEDGMGEMQKIAIDDGAKFDLSTQVDEVDKSSCKDLDYNKQEANGDVDDNETVGIYKTTSVLKIQKETTV